ncbi:XRE family transcriptional regulator [Actinophytocola gossypii]|uniref:Helix-turn-helix domain-containing protein n=1 Tax=Actinophytocola gossypii TaxID=2812003 RepID=A0ABT2JH65_9PSEU|nr:XRE family transcriptional regulator [Actinophytocola gossypii]MCT2587217.1 helix-turn-helix domain-containing protein [Actinophytocola gossypii]
MTGQFGGLLRGSRRRAGLTQEELAERTGLSVRTVRRLETGASANPQLDTVRLLGDALNLDQDDRARLLAAADGRVVAEPAVNANRPESAFERRLADACDELAHAVRKPLREDEEQRRIQDPTPLPVRWQLAPDNVMDHWENICRTPPGATAAALDLDGRLPEIADVYRRVPSGRLVVLGRAGSGKSVLAVRFVLDLLRTRTRGDAVPVVFGLGSWDPTRTGLREWLAGQLIRDHPGLAATGADGTNLADALVEAGLILPVLDGFDELAAGLHRAALDALNVTTMPLLLTSRPGEYAAVAGVDALTAAAAVRLTDLTVTDLVDYLPRTTRANVWNPVLDELRDHPERPAAVNLRAVLTTPLMVSLARTIYSDPAAGNPAELLDTARFGSQYALEDHLLATFVPTVYRNPRWDPDRTRGWLGYLARHLDRLGTHDLAWWHLGGGMRRRFRALVVGLVSGLAVGLATGPLLGTVNTLLGGSWTIGLVAFFGNWTAFGLALGLVHGAGITLGGGAFEPSRVRLRARGGARQLRSTFVPRLAAGTAGGVGLGLVLGAAGAAGLDPLGLVGFGFLGAFGTGVGLGALAGLGWGLMAVFEAPVDIRSVVRPADLLRTNRKTVVVQFLGGGLVLGTAYLLVIAFLVGDLHPLAIPLVVVISPVIGLAIGTSLTAWGQWVVFARIWLPLTGRLPWAVSAFLDDAYRRGVLRQVGAVYQFRHARLQTHLADTA